MTDIIFHADTLSPDCYAMYRLYRFGDAGRYGKEGVARCAEHHGVGVRAWFLYEQGKRSPSHAQRQRIARWLNFHAARAATLEATDPT